MLRINFQLKGNEKLSNLKKYLSGSFPGDSIQIQRFISERLAIEKYFGIPAKAIPAKLPVTELFNIAYNKMEDSEKGLFNIWQVTLPYPQPLKRGRFKEIEASLLKSLPEVNFICPERTYELSQTPNDPLFLDEELQSLSMIQCEAAWDISKGAGITVAVIDSGIIPDHPDIEDNILRDSANNPISSAFINGAILTNIQDSGLGHGTHVSGIIAAEGDNAIGITGVAPAAKIMPIKAFSDVGQARSLDLARAMYFAEEKGAHIINNSWFYNKDASSIAQDDHDEDFALLKAIRFVIGKKVICVFAAGNNGKNIDNHWLVRETDTIVVAATTLDDDILGVSNLSTFLTIAAPGASITSLGIDGVNYPRKSGTSFSAAHVSGALALYLSRHPGPPQRVPSADVIKVLRDVRYSDDIQIPDVGTYRLNCNKLVHAP